jgi:hypothetical protein
VKKVLFLAAVVIGAFAVPASALTYDETDGVYGPPGSQLVVGTEAVPAAAVGLRCDVIVDLPNNDSTRPGSDITISTGSDSHVFLDTEASPGDPGPQTVQMVMGDTLTATLTFGPNQEFDGTSFDNAAFSGAGTVTVGGCESPTVSPDDASRGPEVGGATAVRPSAAPAAVVARPAFTG